MSSLDASRACFYPLLTFSSKLFWDIETASGEYRFRKVWEVIDDKFFPELYNTIVPADASASGIASQFAIAVQYQQ